MVAFEVKVGKIVPQRDEYIGPAGASVDAEDFFDGKTKATDVGAFKRFVVDLIVSKNGASETAKLVISIRGRVVTNTGALSLDVKPVQLFNAVRNATTRFDYASAAEPYYPKMERGAPVAPVPIEKQSDRKMHFSITGDPMWLADVMHHLRDAGGFDNEGRLPT